MGIGVTLANGLSAQLIVEEENKHEQEPVAIPLQHLGELIVLVKQRNLNNATLLPVQLMVNGAIGEVGVLAQNLVEEELRYEQGLVLIQLQHTEVESAQGVPLPPKIVTHIPVQLMVDGVTTEIGQNARRDAV